MKKETVVIKIGTGGVTLENGIETKIEELKKQHSNVVHYICAIFKEMGQSLDLDLLTQISCLEEGCQEKFATILERVVSGSKIDESAIDNLSRQVFNLRKKGKNVIIVSSGACGAGRAEILHDEERLKRYLQLNIGQILEGKDVEEIMELDNRYVFGEGQRKIERIYEKIFSRHNMQTKFGLTTHADISNDNNLRNLVNSFFQMGDVLVVNENDFASSEELHAFKDGAIADNDMLAIMLAQKIEADEVIMLTNGDGIWDENKARIDQGNILTCDKILQRKNQVSSGGTGGMKNKAKAIKRALQSFINVQVCDAKSFDVFKRQGTYFKTRAIVLHTLSHDSKFNLERS